MVAVKMSRNCRGSAPRLRISAEHDLPNNGVVRQHADHDVTIGKAGHLGRRREPHLGELLHAIRTAYVASHFAPGLDQILGHRGAHTAKPYEADALRYRPA